MSDIHIKVETEKLVSISTDVTGKIGKVQSAFAELESVISNTSNYWDGDGHDAFIGAYQIRKDDYERILNNFKEYITNLQQIAGVYSQTENYNEDLSEGLMDNVIF